MVRGQLVGFLSLVLCCSAGAHARVDLFNGNAAAQTVYYKAPGGTVELAIELQPSASGVVYAAEMGQSSGALVALDAESEYSAVYSTIGLLTLTAVNSPEAMRQRYASSLLAHCLGVLLFMVCAYGLRGFV